MTVQERVTKLEENMLVQAELLARFERRVDQFMERTEEWMDRTEEWMEQTEARMGQAEARITQLEGISTAVLERMDRFIRGREGNGHRQPGE